VNVPPVSTPMRSEEGRGERRGLLAMAEGVAYHFASGAQCEVAEKSHCAVA
jgi:hypothetical protein